MTAFILSTSVTAQEDEKCIPMEEWALIVADLNAYLKTYEITVKQEQIIDSLNESIEDYRMLYEAEKLVSSNNEALYESCKEELNSKKGIWPWMKQRAREILIGAGGAIVGAVTVLLLTR